MAPEKIIAETNLKAEFIAVGQVARIGLAENPACFYLKITHVIKGHDRIKPGDVIRLMVQATTSGTEGVTSRVQGIKPVKVQAGQLVLVYFNRSDSHQGYYKPILEGSSVVVLEKPATDETP